MKKLSLILSIGLSVLLLSCDDSDEVLDDLQNVSLNNTIETVVSSEEATEDVMKSVDYETDLYALVQSEYTKSTTTKSISTDTLISQYFRMLRRYKKDELPDMSVEFGEEGQDFPVTITLNYGDSTALNSGRVLSGVMQITMSAPPFTNGAVREIDFVDFACDSILINGWKRIEHTGEHNASRKFNCTSELTFQFPDETEIFRVANRTKEWVSGLDTKLDISDDRIEIKGSVTCVDSEQNEYSKQIAEDNPLIRIRTCRAIVSGVVIFSQNAAEFARLDYGEEECDNIATYTYKNEAGKTETKEIQIGNHNRHSRRNGQ